MINRFRDLDFGGVVCNVSFDQYLESEPKWQAFVNAVKSARDAGFAMWLYDERGYPSGNAGGITLRDHPEWQAYGLLIADTRSPGGLVTLTLPPGKLILANAFAVKDNRIDLSDKIDLASRIADGALSWQAPSGNWYVMAITESTLYEGTHADSNLYAKIPYINLLMPEPTARFVDVTYDNYAKYLGPDLSQYFMASFTDEPSLMSLFLRPMPYRPLPWSPGFSAEFQKRRGYPLKTENLPALVTNAGPAGAKIRYDYWQTVGDLVSENYFGQIRTRCRQYHIPSGGHLLLEEGIVGHVTLYGDFFQCIRHLDAPSIDCLTSIPAEVPWYVARLLSSAGELEGRPLIMSETSDHSQVYRPQGDQRSKQVVTEAQIRGTCNRLIVSGVNCITSYYSFAELKDDQYRRLNQWVGRCCASLRGGHQVIDIAVVYPTETLWTRFEPSRHWTSGAKDALAIEKIYRNISESLFTSQRDFTFIDSQAIQDATAQDSAFIHGPLKWRVIILPGVDTLPQAAWDKLARFVQQGGVLIALGALPANNETEFPSRRIKALAREIFGQSAPDTLPGHTPQCHINDRGGVGLFLPNGLEGMVPQLLNQLLEPDTRVSPAQSPIRVTHRRIDDHDIYFTINDSDQPWQGELTFAATGPGEHWNPATGALESSLSANSVSLKLESYGAAIFRFTSARAPKRYPLSQDSMPTITLKSLPQTKPTMGHGEFVKAQLTSDINRVSDNASVWQAAATLTKSDVDTHLFLVFHYDQPLDLSDADCLAIDTHIPENQATPSQILVIIHETGGGDFLASSGRSMSQSGWDRTYLPIASFNLAGWSKDANGLLDLDKIADIRVGWGGYFGKENESIQFSTTQPRSGVITGK